MAASIIPAYTAADRSREFEMAASPMASSIATTTATPVGPADLTPAAKERSMDPNHEGTEEAFVVSCAANSDVRTFPGRLLKNADPTHKAPQAQTIHPGGRCSSSAVVSCTGRDRTGHAATARTA
jgi:hypothetical protein